MGLKVHRPPHPNLEMMAEPAQRLDPTDQTEQGPPGHVGME